MRFTGNILDAEIPYFGYPIWLNNTAGTAANNMKEIESNSFLVKGSGTQTWGVGQTQYNSWNGFKGDKYVAATNNFTDPQWVDAGKTNFKANSFETQNNVVPNINVTNDL